MTIKREIQDNYTIVTVSGNMEYGSSALQLFPYIEKLIKAGQKNIIVDLEQVKWFSSNGLASLLAAHTTLQEKGGQLRIAHPTHSINSTFKQTQLTKILNIYDSVDAAVVSISSTAGAPSYDRLPDSHSPH
ncbi:STAS domain-containing protein [Candidatus Neomarinimicrobiota bacterium]